MGKERKGEKKKSGRKGTREKKNRKEKKKGGKERRSRDRKNSYIMAILPPIACEKALLGVLGAVSRFI